MGIGSNKLVVSTREKTRPSALASTKSKLSSVLLGKITLKICLGKSLDLMSLIFLLKWSANSSQRASVGVLEDLFQCVFVKRSVVEKRIFWLVLCSLMGFWKCETHATLTALLSM